MWALQFPRYHSSYISHVSAIIKKIYIAIIAEKGADYWFLA